MVVAEMPTDRELRKARASSSGTGNIRMHYTVSEQSASTTNYHGYHIRLYPRCGNAVPIHQRGHPLRVGTMCMYLRCVWYVMRYVSQESFPPGTFVCAWLCVTTGNFLSISSCGNICNNSTFTKNNKNVNNSNGINYLRLPHCCLYHVMSCRVMSSRTYALG